MKRFSLIFALCLAAASTVASQKSAPPSLVITGSVLGVERACANGKPVSAILLYLQFRNDGLGPLLLIKPSFLFTTKINFNTARAGDSANSTVAADVVSYNPYLDNPFGTATSDDYDPVPSFVKKLDGPAPPFVLASGAYMEFQDRVWVKNGFQVDSGLKPARQKCEDGNVRFVPEYSSFNLEYHLSLRKYDSSNELLRNLQDRWKRFGHFPLDGDGDISYKSETIIFGTGN